ncbi:MAG: nuclear transport factor 2 family protein, partial [Saprospiraceae bacterium]
MKSHNILTISLLLFAGFNATAQTENSKSEFEQITATLMDYIDGTGNGEPERLRKAFHPDFNLYTVTQDTLWIRSGEKYIANVKAGEKTSRIGRIISI